MQRNRNILLVLIAMALAFPVATASAQKTSKKRKKAAVVQNHRRKPSRSRSPKAASPIAAVAHYTSPRSAAALASDLGIFLERTHSGQWGVMITSVSRGDTLFSRNPGLPLRPASTMKLFTTGLAFDRFGPEYQFSTDVLRDGPVSSDGTLHGNIILRGDGDPSLSGRFLDGGPNAPMAMLAQRVVAAGIKHITGDVIGDATAFDDSLIPDGWLHRYLGAGYAARVSGLSLNENIVWVAVSPGADGHAQVALEPMTTAMTIVNKARTVGGRGANLRMSKKSDGTITVTGSIGRQAGTRRYSYVVDDPAMFATGALRAALQAAGVAVGGTTRLAPTPAKAVKVASLASPTLARMVSAMNRESINHYAELLFRDGARGPQRTVQGTVANGNHAMHEFFARVGADTSTIYNADGSGLSVNDRLTARAMVQLLDYAHRATWGPEFHASLPVAGESGTQRMRMKGSPAQGNLHAKTGTTNDVIALAGYVTATDGEILAFSFLYNGSDRWNAKSTIDVMGETLASFARD
ncbi:MAG TPA: D-alanyl-D-alanine carboxypeptidase/D-alanyl-D-alanine-endopeptidase [Gemmatimonadaceae bacterium]|nr:D-alanyl-D-alanine carboxypeptidase/D-alanyl-D-alanine-endopeptidase [Gemmatimonadaceae bacterium]